MNERLFIQGTEAAGHGAVNAGCEAYFAYPITPVNDVTEWCSREFPKRGKVFIQASSETSAINMLYGAAAAGKRAFTATAGPGWGLMQETMSHLANAELPAVVLLCSRGGPGQGVPRHGQSEYFTATRGGGMGGYRTIVLAAHSAQDMHDYMQLAFHLGEKYRIPTIVLADGILALTAEIVEPRVLDFGPRVVPAWAVGANERPNGMRRGVNCSQGTAANGPGCPPPRAELAYWTHLNEKHIQVAAAEVRFDAFHLEGAEVVLVAYGYVARVCKEAVRRARANGIKAGLIRPITLWPFPSDVMKERAEAGCRFLVVEDTFGMLVEDVRLAVNGKTDVHLLGMWARHQGSDGGALTPNRVLEEILRLDGGRQ